MLIHFRSICAYSFTGLLLIAITISSNIGLGASTDTLAITSPSQSYAVPEDAYFVAPDGREDNTGTRANSPWPVEKALRDAPSGATIVFRGGTYRIGEIRFNKNYTLQPHLSERPVLKGSQVVTDWQKAGDDWQTNWPYHFDPSNPNATDELRRGDIEMVWINNAMLTPVESRDAVEPGTFYQNEDNDQLYIGTNPQGKTVEVTRYMHSFERVWWNLSGSKPDETGVTVRGLTFTHYAVDGFWSRVGETVLENNRFINNAHRGLIIYRGDSIVRGNEISNNRIKGGNFPTFHRGLFEHNIVRNNSFEGGKNSDNNIGIKFGFADNATIQHNLVEDNGGHGIWLDVGANNNTVVNNMVQNNSEAGIHFEISDGAILAGNLLVNNRYGIWVTTSSNGRVYNNTFVDNVRPFHIREYYRDDNDAQQGPGNSANTQIVNNIFANATDPDWPQSLMTVRSALCGDWQLVSKLNHNAYYRTDATQPRYVFRWDNAPSDGPAKQECGNQKQSLHLTLKDFQEATGFEKNGMEFTGDSDPFFVDKAEGDYQLAENSPAIDAGAALPKDITEALGWPTTGKVDLGAYQTGIDIMPPGLPADDTPQQPNEAFQAYLALIIR